MTAELVTWLRLQLDEDQWFAEELRRVDGWHVPYAVSRGRGQWWCTDANRLLAEVAAKRSIIELYDVTQERSLPPVAWVLLAQTVKHLALPYADRPGYLEEWRPTPEAADAHQDRHHSTGERSQPSPHPLVLRGLYTIPGLDGVWRFLSTGVHGLDPRGSCELGMNRVDPEDTP